MKGYLTEQIGDCDSILCLLQVLASLLHLGNVQFAESEDESEPCELEDQTQGERQRLLLDPHPHNV